MYFVEKKPWETDIFQMPKILQKIYANSNNIPQLAVVKHSRFFKAVAVIKFEF